ncbi:MAG: winged helix-turn-helix domain-containing protein [Gammaproteobacteria bacterium]|nr:winged helix-turn-helix domain-containing protein [Gammaproteobacteria bacterium]
MSVEINGKVFKYDLYILDDGGSITKLEPLVSDLLQLLVERAGTVVSRDEIIDRVWQGRIVSEGSITRNISLLRRFLGVTDDGERCIVTVPKHGYLLQEHLISIENEIHCDELKGSMLEQAQAENLSVDQRVADKVQTKEVLANDLDQIKVSKATTNRAVIFSISVTIVLAVLVVYIMSKSERAPFPVDDLGVMVQSQFKIKHPTESRAFCLDGEKDYIELDENKKLHIGISDFSVTAWVKTTSHELMTIVDQRDERYNDYVIGFSLFLYEGELGFQIADRRGSWHCKNRDAESACSNWLTNIHIADGNWHHVAVSVDRDIKDGLIFYVDGVEVYKRDPTFRRGYIMTENSLRIGSRSSSATTLLQGAIGEVSLFNYAITPFAAAKEFEAGIKRSCDHL